MLLIETLSYSFHLGNDKNKSYKARQVASKNKSGTTSFNNNAIQNTKGLSKVGHHNLRMYDNKQEDISILVGSIDLVKDVKTLYSKEFEDARIEYNEKQKRNDRKIQDYFKHISDNAKTDLACEIIIELGDFQYWSNQTKEERYKMKDVFMEQIKDLENVVPSFKIANAVVHFDEQSPHLHVVGVPVKIGGKNGMKKQVGKTTIFTKESLEVIQDKMRELCIESFNKIYSTNKQLKPKAKGRNMDFTIEEMEHYQEFKKQYENKKQQLDIVIQKTESLEITTQEVKGVIDNLKPSRFKNNTFSITNEQKQQIENYITKVTNSTKNIKHISNLTLSLENVEKDINSLNKTIKEKDSKINALNKTLDNSRKDVQSQMADNDYLRKENNYLKNQIRQLQDTIDILKDKWNGFIRFIKKKLFSWGEREELYKKVYQDLIDCDVLDKKDCTKIKENDYEMRM